MFMLAASVIVNALQNRKRTLLLLLLLLRDI